MAHVAGEEVEAWRVAHRAHKHSQEVAERGGNPMCVLKIVLKK